MTDVVHVQTKEDLDKLLDSGRPVVVKWWATWCRPCSQLSPHYARAAAEVKDKVFVEIDVDRAPELAKEHGVMGVPRVELYENGEVKEVQSRNVMALIRELKSSRV